MLNNTKLSREQIMKMTMEEFKKYLPESIGHSHPLFYNGLITLCAIGGQTSEYLDLVDLPRNERDFATARLLQKTKVNEVLEGWLNQVQQQHNIDTSLRCKQIQVMREFVEILGQLGFPRDLDDDTSEYNQILDTFDIAEQKRLRH